MSAKQDAYDIQHYILSHWPHEQVILPAATGDDSGSIYGSVPKEYAAYQAFQTKSFSSPTELKNFLSDLNTSGMLIQENGLSASLQKTLQATYTTAVGQYVSASVPVNNNPANISQVDNTSKSKTTAPKVTATATGGINNEPFGTLPTPDAPLLTEGPFIRHSIRSMVLSRHYATKNKQE